MSEPTPQERYLRDLANSVYVRLRSLERDGGNAVELRAEARRIADFLRARLDQRAKED